MAQCLLNVMTGGVSKSLLEQVTAGAADVLKDKVIVDKNGNPLTGTMPNNGSWDTEVGIGASVTIPKGYHDGTGVAKNSTTDRGAWSGTVAVNGSVTIPAGYHNGSGKVTNTTPTMNGQTITPKASQQTVSCSGKYMNGNIVIQGDADLVASNIIIGKNIFGINGSARSLKTKTGYVDTSTSRTSYPNIGSAYTIQLNNIGFTPVAFAFMSTDLSSAESTMYCENMYSPMGNGKGVAVSGPTGTMGYANIDNSTIIISSSVVKVPFWAKSHCQYIMAGY